jgi:hypothetical protein
MFIPQTNEKALTGRTEAAYIAAFAGSHLCIELPERFFALI